MAQVPAGTKFLGVDPAFTDLTERKGTKVDRKTEYFSTDEIRGYKVYTALLTQEGTDAPVAIILENTLGVDIVWIRLSTGFYRATPSESIFLENKTFHFVNSNNQGVNFEVASFLNDTDDWRIQVLDTGEVVDSSLQNLPIEIRVYN